MAKYKVSTSRLSVADGFGRVALANPDLIGTRKYVDYNGVGRLVEAGVQYRGE